MTLTCDVLPSSFVLGGEMQRFENVFYLNEVAEFLHTILSLFMLHMCVIVCLLCWPEGLKCIILKSLILVSFSHLMLDY